MPVDEAGRGPLAGPVVSAAVILRKGIDIKNLNDSKKLSPPVRFAVYKEIMQNVIEYQVGIIDNFTIDRINILEATKLAMQKAVEDLGCKVHYLILDGNFKIKSKLSPKSRS